MTVDIERIMSIFFPNMQERMSSVRANKTRFVHYTSAEAALNILRTKKVWMRKSSSMNDFSGVQHGLSCVRGVYNESSSGLKLRGVLNRLFPNITEEIERPFKELTSLF